jgi:RNA polymerase sigma factor (sigma-70 family)
MNGTRAARGSYQKAADKIASSAGQRRAPALIDAAVKEEQTRQLLRSFAGGDVDAFWRLWDLHNRHLYHLCLWQMGGIQDDAEEALSRAMLRAFEKLPSNSHQIQNFRAWLSKLTLNLCVDVHRERTRQIRRLKSIEDLWFDASDLLTAVANSPEEAFLSREVFGHLCNEVDDLPLPLREPFVLRFFQEMAYRDIATRLILSTENVRKRIQQARDILRQRLERVGPVGPPAIRAIRSAKRFTAPNIPLL